MADLPAFPVAFIKTPPLYKKIPLGVFSDYTLIILTQGDTGMSGGNNSLVIST